MRFVKIIILGVLTGSFSNAATAGIDCSIEEIESLAPGGQLERYTTCSRLMNSRLSLLKANKQIKEINNTTSPDLGDNLPGPQGASNQFGIPTNTLPSSTLPSSIESIEIVENSSVALASWSNGRTMKVKKGSQIAEGVVVLKVAIDGITVSSPESTHPIFIGRGSSTEASTNTRFRQ